MTKCKCGAEPFEQCGCFKSFPKPDKKKKRQKTPEEKDHLAWVASQPCSIPGCPNRSNVHHIREHGEPRDHFKTIPLCWDHHQGDGGLHGLGKYVFRERYGHELDMLEELMKRKNQIESD